MEQTDKKENTKIVPNLETLVNSFPEGLIVYEKNGTNISIVMLNQYLCDLVGIKRE